MSALPYITPSLAHLADKPHVVYEAWCGDICMYVGMTYDLRKRMSCHRSRSGWARYPYELRTTEYPTRHEAERAERQRIVELRPVNNLWIPARRPA